MTAGKIEPVPLHFVIVGGGITGLTCALGLRHIGYTVTVLEKKGAAHMHRMTGGCRIPPNLTKILFKWGLSEAIQDISILCNAVHLLQLNTGEYLGGYSWDDEFLSETEGELAFVQLAQLWELLYCAAIRTGAEYHFNAEVVCIDTEQSIVTLKSGETVESDVVVGADGVDGICLKYMDYPDTLLGDTGLEVIDFTTSKQAILDQLNTSASESHIADMFIWMGSELSIMGFPVVGPGAYDTDSHTYAKSRKNNPDFHISIYAYNDPHSGSLRDDHDSRGNNISLRGVLPEWVKERLVMIGSAAHPLPPGSLQSHALAIEDGAVLARLFSHLTSVNQIDDLLRAFQTIRQPRCDEIHTKEYGIVFFMTMSPGEEEEYRNHALRVRQDAGLSVISGDLDLEYSMEEREVRDVFGYDALDEADGWWADWGICRERHETSASGRSLGTLQGKQLMVEVERSTSVVVGPFFS
ncbi:FAD/NAD(P)-binding domain-containing protein [Marasmius fiardii PR-910]|nr:FAD/NAD(P)-binding domain-containing protein [Marasmius fiardii PR-910]